MAAKPLDCSGRRFDLATPTLDVLLGILAFGVGEHYKVFLLFNIYRLPEMY